MAISLGPGPVVMASGELTALDAAELKKQIQAVAGAAPDAALDLSGAVDVDMAILQVIVSARRSYPGLRLRDAAGTLRGKCLRLGLGSQEEGYRAQNDSDHR